MDKQCEKVQKTKKRRSSAPRKASGNSMKTVGREVGRQLIRGLFGTLKR